jgi:hypothetical protein
MKGRIAPMEEHHVEAVTVQVRILLRPQLRVWCNGSMAVSKTVDIGSNPVTRAIFKIKIMRICVMK